MSPEREAERIDELLRLQSRAPAPALAPAVLRRLAERTRPRSLLRPLALGLAAVTTILSLGVAVGYGLGRSGAPSSLPALAQSPSLRTVHFALNAPGARTVVLVGDFNGWTPDTGTVLASNGVDRFAATMELVPGRYAYAFVIDGERVVTDDDALVFEPDGFGGRNSVLEL